jgi:SHS family lactate transporter-like MFS transporter
VVANSFFSWAGNIYDLLILTYVYEELAKELGAGINVSTTIVGLGLVARVLGGYLLGRVADTYGRKPVLIASTLGYSLAQAGIAFAQNVAQLFVFRGVQGFFMGGHWVTATVIAYEASPPKIRGTVNGIVQAGYGVGYALTGLAYLVLPPSEWRLFLLTGSLPALLVPYMMWAIPRETDVMTRGQGERKPLDPSVKKEVVRSSLVISGMFASYYSIFAIFNEDALVHGVSKETIGLALLASNLALAVSFIVYGRLSESIDKKKLITIGVLGEAASLPFMLGFLGAEPIVIGLFAYNVATGFWPLAPLLVVERVPKEVRSTVTGLAYNVGSLVGGLSSAAIGFSYTFVHCYATLGAIYGYVPLAVVLGTLLTWKRATARPGAQ